MKQIFVGFSVLLLASCSLVSERDKTRDDPTSRSKVECPYPIKPQDIEIPENILEPEELVPLRENLDRSTQRALRGVGSTPEYATYMNKSIEVDKIIKRDIDGLCDVEVRIKNLTMSNCQCEFRIKFYDGKGTELPASHDWEPFFLNPLDFKTIGARCRIRGAAGFILFIRNFGSTSEGVADEIIQTKCGSKFLGDTVAVEKIEKTDTAEFHRVKIWLKNLTRSTKTIKYKIEFYTNFGKLVERKDDIWKKIKIDGLGTVVAEDTINQKRAIGFKIFVK